ncbi:MAG: DEAD/DEAH box helicase family protein [Balneolales bacterium]|nr:DEAD/DEAH box helicase family protein [Balneolales bacterium]
MLLDNEKRGKVHEWLARYIKDGELDLVTGYFTIGALAWLSDKVNKKVHAYRMVLGDIVHQNAGQVHELQLLNEEISVEAAFHLKKVAQNAIAFLKQEHVQLKTLEPNFCHAKAYIYRDKDPDAQKQFYISGSSNLTEAGIGTRPGHNIELNVGNFGSADEYKTMVTWFNELWNRKEAHTTKTIIETDGYGKKKERKVDFKKYLISEIEKIFKAYTPRDIYYKILFELFKDHLLLEESDPEFSKQVGRLINTEIYNTLFDFQQKGVLSLIKMLQKYNGAILADAVGLGKTWSALAVMKYYQMQGREVILVCPKKLENNWRQYQKNQDSRFEADKFEYFIRFHTDMTETRMETYTDRADKLFTNEKPKLLVIDESHNLRNSKGNRYKFLMEEILKKNADIKVLMLSATPINNSLLDVRNQFSLMVQGNDEGFFETLGIRNLYFLFQSAQRAFSKWSKEPSPSLADFIEKLPPEFFTLTDALTVARTRKMILDEHTGLRFPRKHNPENLFVTPRELGNLESFDDLTEHFPPKMSGYQPSYYIREENITNVLQDEKQREFFLVKMMYILLVKRLESSWKSLQSTVETILKHHQNAFDRIKLYQKLQKVSDADDFQASLFEEDDDILDQLETLSIGKKRPVTLKEIDDNGMLNRYKKDLKADIDQLESLKSNLAKFEKGIAKETLILNNQKSADTKLEKLMEKIRQKQQSGKNRNNKKLVIFTAYTDTATYLYEQLLQRGFTNIACISGQTTQIWDKEPDTKKYEPVLERFAPYTKLYREKEWDFIPSRAGLSDWDQYREWTAWVKEAEPKVYEKLENPIDILIATDVLSEGQNLQDADMVINYDIHWNPVRVIQRMGRIDRIGSPNEEIFGINFWPTDTINLYLNLKGRVERRMAAMRLAGAEVDTQFTKDFQEMAENEDLEERQKRRMLEQMDASWDDIEENDNSLGFDDFSLERFRQDLAAELNEKRKEYERMPNGVFSGFTGSEPLNKSGIVALLGSPTKVSGTLKHTYKTFYLIYIDKNGEPLLMNQKEVLEGLTLTKDKPRAIPEEIDRGDTAAITPLADSVKKWLNNQVTQEKETEDGGTKKTAGFSGKDLIRQIQTGGKKGIDALQGKYNINEAFDPRNVDLICWELISTT